MKLDTRQKYQKLRKFMIQIKMKKGIQAFLDLEDIPKYGIYDFWYINKNPPSFAKIQKKLKQQKYDQLHQFLEDLKQIFISVSDYTFIDDPIQNLCEEFKQEIDRFGHHFQQDFKPIIEHKPIIIKIPKPIPSINLNTKIKIQIKQILPPPPPRIQTLPIQDILYRQRSSTLSQKLEMLFLLRSNENNQPYLRSIGTHYGIGMQKQENYILTINDKNKQWLQFIDKSQ